MINEELDRLIGIYRGNGYFKLTREDLYAEVDTTDMSLMQFTLNPFEQVAQIAAAAKRRQENPNWDIKIKKDLLTIAAN